MIVAQVSRMSANMRWLSCSSASPAGVICTWRPKRMKSGSFSSSSSSRIWRLMADCETWSRAPARVKEPVSAIALMISSCLRSTMSSRAQDVRLRLVVERQHRFEPRVAAAMLAADRLPERLLQRPRDRTDGAGGDGPEIHFSDADHFRRGAREEHLVGVVQAVAHQALLDHIDSGVARECDYGVTGDAFQNPRDRRGRDAAALHEKEVLPGALRDVALGIEHDRVVEAETDGFRLGEERADVIAADLRAGRHDVRMVPRVGRDVRPDARVGRALAVEVLPRPHRDADVGTAVVEVQVHPAFGEVDERTD